MTFPFLSGLQDAYTHLSLTERVVVWILGIALTASTLALVDMLNDRFSHEVPAPGGELREGVVGFPRFVNPLLAITDADRDLTRLVYAGLMKPTAEGGLELELAERYNVSDDGLTYTFVIKEAARFHDGTPVTADDVMFTVRRAQDPATKSPKRPGWEGVTVEKVDSQTVRFVLSEPYSPFLENTTLGILPEHVWRDIDSQQFPFSRFNTEPIGAGPYRVSDIHYDPSGIPRSYTLTPFKHYVLGKPYIKSVRIRFYSNEDMLVRAYRRGDVHAINSIGTDRARTLEAAGHHIDSYPLPRIFGIFFNHNNAGIFTNREVRRALSLSAPKHRILSEVLNGYGTVIDGPLPPGLIPVPDDTASTGSDLESTHAILEENGWTRDEQTGTYQKDGEVLSFTLSTSNSPELRQTAEILSAAWRNVGIDAQTQFYEPGTLNQDIIRPRDYEALLFGEIIGRDRDLFAFWHSSQRNDPGLNIALYTNITVDNIVEEIRTTADTDRQAELYIEFDEEIREDAPAVFLYAPDFIYAVPSHVKHIDLDTVTIPADRFSDIHKWYVETDRLWNIFGSDADEENTV